MAQRHSVLLKKILDSIFHHFKVSGNWQQSLRLTQAVGRLWTHMNPEAIHVHTLMTLALTPEQSEFLSPMHKGEKHHNQIQSNVATRRKQQLSTSKTWGLLLLILWDGCCSPVLWDFPAYKRNKG